MVNQRDHWIALFFFGRLESIRGGIRSLLDLSVENWADSCHIDHKSRSIDEKFARELSFVKTQRLNVNGSLSMLKARR